MRTRCCGMHRVQHARAWGREPHTPSAAMRGVRRRRMERKAPGSQPPMGARRGRAHTLSPDTAALAGASATCVAAAFTRCAARLLPLLALLACEAGAAASAGGRRHAGVLLRCPI